MPTDIRALLRELDLEVHYESFLENGIGQDILSQLTDDDLKELGVTKLGDRKRILNRLAQVGGDASSDEGAEEPVSSAPADESDTEEGPQEPEVSPEGSVAVAQDSTSSETKEELLTLSVKALRARAKSEGLRGYSKLNKGALIALLTDGTLPDKAPDKTRKKGTSKPKQATGSPHSGATGFDFDFSIESLRERFEELKALLVLIAFGIAFVGALHNPRTALYEIDVSDLPTLSTGDVRVVDGCQFTLHSVETKPELGMFDHVKPEDSKETECTVVMVVKNLGDQPRECRFVPALLNTEGNCADADPWDAEQRGKAFKGSWLSKERFGYEGWSGKLDPGEEKQRWSSCYCNEVPLDTSNHVVVELEQGFGGEGIVNSYMDWDNAELFVIKQP